MVPRWPHPSIQYTVYRRRIRHTRVTSRAPVVPAHQARALAQGREHLARVRGKVMVRVRGRVRFRVTGRRG